MINSAEIKAKAEKKYSAYLQSIVEGVPFGKIVITGNKKPSKNFSVFQSEITDLISHSKEKKGYGYTIKYQTISKKEIGCPTDENLAENLCFSPLSSYFQLFQTND